MADSLLNPFGNPEGARADLDDVTKGFVEFGDPLLWKGLATKPSDLSARIFVGRKGSGKTVYLRRARDFASKNSDLFAGELEQLPPPTESIIRFSRLFSDRYDLREKWAYVWRRAILRSVTSYLVNHPHLVPRVPPETRERLRQDYRRLLELQEPYRTHVSVFNETNCILARSTRNAIVTYLFDPLWGQLEVELDEAIRVCQPICLYLDGIDDNFQHAPMYWLECQIGLFKAIEDLLMSPQFGNRLHVFATVRDLVLVKILQSEHAMRNFEEPHARLLHWNLDAARHLLDEKVKHLPPVFFRRGSRGGTVREWLGMERINSSPRKDDEPIELYLIRHTRLLPRDIVTLGNLICQERQRVLWYPDMDTNTDAITRAVRYAARQIGTEQLTICANQIASNAFPRKSGLDEQQTYAGAQEFARTLTDMLREFVGGFRRDRFGIDTLRKQEVEASKHFGEDGDVLSTLWLNGLLGYVDRANHNGSVTFYADEGAVRFKLPRNYSHYAFHPCLIEAAGLQPTGKPVVPCR